MNTKIAPKLLNKILNTKAAQYLNKPNVAGNAAKIALISTTSKDLVACYYYVTQSLNNKKIPEEKRKFVAGLDLSNGILNLVFSLLIGGPMEKLTSKVFDKKIAPKYFSADVAKKMFDKIKPDVDFEAFYGRFSRNRSCAKVGLAVIATLVGTQIIGKRIIVPLFATPMASFFKKKMEKATGDKNSPELNRIIATRMPSITEFQQNAFSGKNQPLP